MRDARLDKWANVLVNYSLGAKKGQSAFIMGDPEAIPLIEAAYEQFILAGVNVECILLDRSQDEFLLQHGTDEQIAFTLQARLFAMQHYDLLLHIKADSNAKRLSHASPQKQRLTTIADKPILETIMRRSADGALRWCFTMFPIPAMAQECEMGNREYEEFVFDACFLNDPDPLALWQELGRKQAALIKYLETKRELRFQNAQGTDLRVNIEGMKWENFDGRMNFPDGEVFTGPNLNAPDGGVNGIARIALPSLYRNVEVTDIELVFKNGAVVSAKASKNEPFLREMIASDQNSKFVGEIAFGTNNHIKKCTKQILFDEKLGETFHLALGAGYPQTGNTNKSAIHWDIIFDLKNGGTVHADGELISKDGAFVRPEWP
jgi:aminopeptidase